MPELVYIDSKPVPCQKGWSILQAIRSANIDLPTLCYEPRLPPQGSCRLCMVQVEGMPNPVASCTTALQPGIRIVTDTKALRDYRRGVLELLLSELPLASECPRCNSALGPCQLHAAAARYDARDGRLPKLTPRLPAHDNNPFIQRDYRWCISCYRCTRICNELEMAHAITPAERGQKTRVFSFPNDLLIESQCTSCGQCINTCPTGALMDRKALQQLGLGAVTRTRTICPYCGTGCGIQLLAQNGKLVGVEPDASSPVSEGSLCVKGQFASWEFAGSKDRLTAPLIRRNGAFQEATWDEAYDLIATRLTGIRDAHGPDSIAFWSSARATNEANYLMQKFARVVVGTNSIDNCART